MRDVSLGAIAYQVGEAMSVTHLPECQSDVECLGALEAEGFQQFRQSEASAMRLAETVLKDTLARSQLKADEIDFVLLCSDSLGDQRENRNNRLIHELCLRLGLTRAYPIGVSQATCGNFCSALRIATSLIRSGEAENILIATADRSGSQQRLMSSKVAVLSDGGASCVVTARRLPGYRVLGFAQRAAHVAASSAVPGDLKLSDQVGSYIAAFEEICRSIGWSADTIDAVIPSNFAASMLKLYADVAGVPSERFFDRNVSRYGHVYAADNLINLSDYQSKQSAPSPTEQRLLLLSSGPANFGLTALTCEPAIQ